MNHALKVVLVKMNLMEKVNQLKNLMTGRTHLHLLQHWKRLKLGYSLELSSLCGGRSFSGVFSPANVRLYSNFNLNKCGHLLNKIICPLQTLTPHMQPAAAKSSRTIGSSSRKTNGNKHVLRDQEQGNNSIELWKKAFKDACERLCPIRAGGHECGCLPVLARLV